MLADGRRDTPAGRQNGAEERQHARHRAHDRRAARPGEMRPRRFRLWPGRYGAGRRGALTGMVADLFRLEGAHRLAKEVIAVADRLAIPVNNAGTSLRESFWDVSADCWDHQFNVKDRSSFVLAQHIVRHLMEQCIPGRIVNPGAVGVRRCRADAAAEAPNRRWGVDRSRAFLCLPEAAFITSQALLIHGGY
ncbi:MAG: SDR family oxidoreductase [Thermomicrobiales bacterium]|nr:SDR family oxidoreductase [Thermomicrobiales bacterium]